MFQQTHYNKHSIINANIVMHHEIPSGTDSEPEVLNDARLTLIFITCLLDMVKTYIFAWNFYIISAQEQYSNPE